MRYCCHISYFADFHPNSTLIQYTKLGFKGTKNLSFQIFFHNPLNESIKNNYKFSKKKNLCLKVTVK